jgi:hypothetical protein
MFCTIARVVRESGFVAGQTGGHIAICLLDESEPVAAIPSLNWIQAAGQAEICPLTLFWS